MYIRKLSIVEVLEYLCTLMIILSSGSGYFGINRCAPTLYVMLFVSLLLLVFCKIKRKIFLQNGIRCIVIMSLIALNLLINYEYSRWDKDFIIFAIRLVSLLIIQSTITGDEFIRKYVQIMAILSIVSLICFSYTMLIGPNLPGLTNENNMLCTFYHTVGVNYVYERNAGIFWEAPAHSVFLNLALACTIIRGELFPQKKRIICMIIFSITIISTLSVFAFFFLGINIVLLLFSGRKRELNNRNKVKSKKSNRRWVIVSAIFLVMILVYAESRYGLIQHKLFNRAGSFGTRYGDTLYTLVVASRRLFTGYGIFNNATSGILSTFNVVNNSNGLAALLMNAGLPLFIVSCVQCVNGIKKFFKTENNTICLLILVTLFFLFHFSEHLWTYTLFISFLLRWKDNPNTNGQQ